MLIFRKYLSLLLSVLILFSLCACTQEDKSEPKKKKETKPHAVAVKQEETELVSTTLSKGAAATPLAKQDFSAAEITYYTDKEPSKLTKSKLAAFSKAHNCTVKIIIGTGNRTDDLTASIATGTPYDIVENSVEDFSKSLFLDIYEPLEAYVTPDDYYNSKIPSDCGLNLAISSRFTLGGKLFAVGSCVSADYYLLYYNRVLFNKSKFQGLQTLWTTGKWSFGQLSQMATVTSVLSGNALLQLPSLSDWLNIKGANFLKYENDALVNNFTDEGTMSAAKDYQDLIYGDQPLSVPKSGSASFKNGKAYTIIDKASNYEFWRETAKKSKVFKENADNLGCVVLPLDMTVSGAQPASFIRCYSALKGTKTPFAAPCYSLFESRIIYKKNESKNTLPANISEYLETTFNTNGFVPSFNIKNLDGSYSVYDLIDSFGMSVRDGGVAKSALLCGGSRADKIIESAKTVKKAEAKNTTNKK